MKNEQILIAKISDKIKKYQKTQKICNTNFLNPAEIIEIEHMVNKVPNCFCGGYENAERKVLIIGLEDEEQAKEILDLITIECVNKKMSHRDVLGSLLGLGINRDVIGDIIIKDNRADVFVINEMSKYIVQNLEKIGREKVKVYKNLHENMLEPESDYKEIKTTVASLRLDAIVSAAIGESREISAKLIQNQKVKLNYKIIENTSKQIKAADKISVRGYGRIELVDVLGETRKDRIRVVLKKTCG